MSQADSHSKNGLSHQGHPHSDGVPSNITLLQDDLLNITGGRSGTGGQGYLHGTGAPTDPIDLSLLTTSSKAHPTDMHTNNQNQSHAPTSSPDIERLDTVSEDLQKQEGHDGKLCKAVEALAPRPPGTDIKTTFWNMYRNVADEYDKEFHQKYSSDIDSSLTFAGLFLVVESAFIVLIQPEIQPHGTLPLTVVAQSLLYISLCTTLLAALIAVLGKQWLMYYSATGERGTLEARGLERQRKFDSIRHWKLEMTIQTCPLLLQIGLMLSLTALSVYLWDVYIAQWQPSL
ncbi:hypothetical protein C8R45DRAFT_1223396 [Mycena sanguinolenta]|nr:hypothetical protein C8R45DRAFT_1223396 [Mycena sanguinolenta]